MAKIETAQAIDNLDDILDVEGHSGELGKTAGKDASSAKPTFPAVFGLERSRALALECVARAKEMLVNLRLQDSWLPAIADWVLSRRN